MFDYVHRRELQMRSQTYLNGISLASAAAFGGFLAIFLFVE